MCVMFRQKVGGVGCGGPQDGSVLVQNLVNGLALEFECSEPLKRLRLLLSEIIFVMAQVRNCLAQVRLANIICIVFGT